MYEAQSFGFLAILDTLSCNALSADGLLFKSLKSSEAKSRWEQAWSNSF